MSWCTDDKRHLRRCLHIGADGSMLVTVGQRLGLENGSSIFVSKKMKQLLSVKELDYYALSDRALIGQMKTHSKPNHSQSSQGNHVTFSKKRVTPSAFPELVAHNLLHIQLRYSP